MAAVSLFQLPPAIVKPVTAVGLLGDVQLNDLQTSLILSFKHSPHLSQESENSFEGSWPSDCSDKLGFFAFL